MLKSIYPIVLLCCIAFTSHCYADTTVWKGEVNSNGNPSPLITLALDKQYKIKASGVINLGKWWQQGKELGVDACYAYNDELRPSLMETLKNSMQISLCDQYHKDHVYESKPFRAKQNGIHFWVYDIDYTDNNGVFQVEVIEVEEQH